MENGKNMWSHDKGSQMLLCQTVKNSSPSTDQAACLWGHAMKKNQQKSDSRLLSIQYSF